MKVSSTVPVPPLVCWFRLDQPGHEDEQLEQWLSADERERCRRLFFPVHQRRQRVACAMLRRLLADLLHCAPLQLQFQRRAHGKPYLPGCEFEFNLSHSEEYAVLGVSQRGEVGVDLEDSGRDVDWQRLAPRYFSAAEAELVRQAGRDLFFRIWTAKEAYIKAIGTGLSLPLDHFVTVTSRGEWGLQNLHGESLPWHLQPLTAPFSRAVAAWVAQPGQPPPRSYRYGPEGHWQPWP